MRGVMTEKEFLGIISEQLESAKVDPRYRSGLISSFNDIDNPCHLQDLACADGVLAGKELRQLFLNLGKMDDEQVERAVAKILFPDMSECLPDTVLVLVGWRHGRHGWKSPFVVEDP